MGERKPSKTNYAIPGAPVTQQEMDEMIKQAENGTFHSLKVLKQKIDDWKAHAKAQRR